MSSEDFSRDDHNSPTPPTDETQGPLLRTFIELVSSSLAKGGSAALSSFFRQERRTPQMCTHQQTDVYETILREEQKDRRSFWAISLILLATSALLVAAVV